MPDIYNIPSKFLQDEGFPVVIDDARLSGLFDDHMDDQSDWLRIGSVDGVGIDEQFSPSEVLYRLARREYDHAFQQWSVQYVLLKDGSFLHQDYAQRAWDCWSIHCENNKTHVEEEN